MSEPADQYYLSADQSPAEALAKFRTLGEVQIEPTVVIHRTFLDTFDWRLYVAGGLLVEEREPYVTRTLWRRLKDNRLLGQISAATPRFARDLQAGNPQEQLAQLIEMRALLPMVRVTSRVHRAAVTNRQQKIVLRLVIEEAVARDPEEAFERPLRPRLCLEPLKGYRKPLQSAHDIIERNLKLLPAEHQLDEALAAIGQEAADSSGKLRIDLTPELPAGEALRRILRQLLAAMEANFEGTRDNLDSEFLHDFRVAVRRTRSVFSQIRGVLPPAILERFRPGFKWLGGITGPTRDLDVYQLKLPAYRNSLPAAMRDSLQPLEDFLSRRQQQEQRKLARALDSGRCRRLLADWRGFLEQDWDPDTWPERSRQPIGQLADKRIWKAYRLVLREGEAIGEEAPAQALHDLRISCKKLRYLMEFFTSLYPRKKIRKQIKVLKLLQDNLGDFNDLEVQAEALIRFGNAMQERSGDLPGETLMAMGMLVDNLQRRQHEQRQAFARRFAQFAQPQNRKSCRELFHG